jgi:formylglycine-generating enzyme required for sulfatase activity
MPEANFDPYHKWLGIPPEEQPANHYRLLGIQLFESDPDVIESAATRQITHVRSFAIGKHGELTQAILNEIAEAKLCLLLPERKRKYDNSLNKPHSADQPVETVSCPACDARLAINNTLYGKLVKCPTCTATCRISVDGKQASEESGVNENEGNSLLDVLPKSEVQASAGTFTGVAGPKRKSTKVSRKKKSTLNWIVVVAVPTGAICGIALAVVLLWVLFKKDPLGIMVADAPARQFLETAREPSTNTTVNPEATKAAHSRLGESDKAGRVQQTNGPRPSPAVAPFDAAKAKEHQEAWATYLGVDVQRTNSIGMRFVLIPPGTCPTGSYTFEENEKPVHEVQVEEPFELGVSEVTQEQYARVMGKNPSLFKASSHPVENVTWLDAVDFCEKLSLRPQERDSGYVYRLPKEYEWEYACRAGTTTDYSLLNATDNLDDFAWLKANSEDRSHAVGQKSPNPWHLNDMHGNVWEWCLTGLYRYGANDDTTPEPQISTNPIRIQRGGGWAASAEMARSASRGQALINYRGKDHGFRVLRYKRQHPKQSSNSAAKVGQQPLSIDLLQRIGTDPSGIHKDWQRNSDGTLSANVHANHDVLRIPVPELSTLSSYGLIIEFGNNGRRTGKPRFSIKVPHDDGRQIIAGYYYGATYNLSVSLQGAGVLNTRNFLGYHSLSLNVTQQSIDVGVNNRTLGRIEHERGKRATEDACVIELSGISGSWMHFHLKSVHLLVESSEESIAPTRTQATEVGIE